MQRVLDLRSQWRRHKRRRCADAFPAASVHVHNLSAAIALTDRLDRKSGPTVSGPSASPDIPTPAYGRAC
jgi:hypothetical protein